MVTRGGCYGYQGRLLWLPRVVAMVTRWLSDNMPMSCRLRSWWANLSGFSSNSRRRQSAAHFLTPCNVSLGGGHYHIWTSRRVLDKGPIKISLYMENKTNANSKLSDLYFCLSLEKIMGEWSSWAQFFRVQVTRSSSCYIKSFENRLFVI